MNSLMSIFECAMMRVGLLGVSLLGLSLSACELALDSAAEPARSSITEPGLADQSIGSSSDAPIHEHTHDDSVEKQTARRICYLERYPENLYFKRSTNRTCSDLLPGGKNMPTLTRHGRRVDMSICENFTNWTVNRAHNVCEKMSLCESCGCCNEDEHAYTNGELRLQRA